MQIARVVIRCFPRLIVIANWVKVVGSRQGIRV